MSAQPLRMVPPPTRELIDTLPTWQRAWWQWAETGITAWGREVGTVLWWGCAGLALVVLSGPALVGQVCRGIVRRKGER